MTKNQKTFLNRIAEAFATLRSAVRAAAAVRYGRSPATVDLRRLGMDPRAFTSLSHG